MPNFRLYSTTPASNASVGATNFAEGQLPSTVNDSLRNQAADIKGALNELPWYDIGYTPTRISNTSFSVPFDATAIFTADRRLKLGDSATLYGTVVSASFGAGVTTVTVALDSGALSASLATVHYAVEDPGNVSAPADFGRRRQATTGGTGTAYTASFTPKLPALSDGVRVTVMLHAACGTTPTLAADGLAAKEMRLPGNVAIATNDLAANTVLDLTFKTSPDKWLIEGPPAAVTNALLSSIHANALVL